MLVGVFGVSSEFDAGTLTVDGGGLFLHGRKLLKSRTRHKGRVLFCADTWSGRMSEAGQAFGTDATATDRGHPSPISQRGKGIKEIPCQPKPTRETKTEHTVQM